MFFVTPPNADRKPHWRIYVLFEQPYTNLISSFWGISHWHKWEIKNLHDVSQNQGTFTPNEETLLIVHLNRYALNPYLKIVG